MVGMFHLQDDSGWIHHLSMGWAYTNAGQRGWSLALDRSNRMGLDGQGIYPSCIPTIPSPGCISTENPNQILFFRYSDSRWLTKVSNPLPHEEINHKDHLIFDHRNQRFTANWILPNLYGIEFSLPLENLAFEKFTMKSFALPFRVSTRRVGSLRFQFYYG